MLQGQQMRLMSTNLLLKSMQINTLIGNLQAEAGILPATDEDIELEDDDG